MAGYSAVTPREPDRMSEDRERKPTCTGPLTAVKCKQRNAQYKRDPSSLFQVSWIAFFYKNPALLLVALLFSPFPIFWTFLKAAGRKLSVFVQYHNASLYLKLRQNGIEIITEMSSVLLIFDSEKC